MKKLIMSILVAVMATGAIAHHAGIPDAVEKGGAIRFENRSNLVLELTGVYGAGVQRIDGTQFSRVEQWPLITNHYGTFTRGHVVDAWPNWGVAYGATTFTIPKTGLLTVELHGSAHNAYYVEKYTERPSLIGDKAVEGFGQLPG